MNKTILLLSMLSVYAMHGADKADGKEEELPMKSIKEYKELGRYANRVVAFTSTRACLDGGIAAFTLGDTDWVNERTRYGVLHHYCKEFSYDNPSKPFKYIMNVRLFTKTKVAGLCILADVDLKDEGTPYLEGENKEEEFLRNANLEIRLATPEEKKELKQAILDDKAMLQLPKHKEFALQYLDKES